jgi:hypothetical protein
MARQKMSSGTLREVAVKAVKAEKVRMDQTSARDLP